MRVNRDPTSIGSDVVVACGRLGSVSQAAESTRPATGRALAAVVGPSAVPDPEISLELEELEAVSTDLAQRRHTESTKRAYRGAWKSFERFCLEHDLTPLPAHPEAIRWYVAWMAQQMDVHGQPRFAVTTVRTHLAGIAEAHLRAGLLDPTSHHGVSELVRGLSRLRGTRPVGRKPLLLADVSRVVEAMDHDVYPAGISAARDTLALWLGFATALRRSEAAGLRLGSVRLHPEDGAHVRVGRSKTNQSGQDPDLVVLPFGRDPRTCPVCALLRWAELLRVTASTPDRRQHRREVMRLLLGTDRDVHVCTGGRDQPLERMVGEPAGMPLLRATYRNRRSGTIHERGVSGDALHTMLLTRIEQAGMDPRGYGFHSLRSGHVTQARRLGATTEEIMRAGRWTRAETIETYDQEYNPLVRNSVTRLGL